MANVGEAGPAAVRCPVCNEHGHAGGVCPTAAAIALAMDPIDPDDSDDDGVADEGDEQGEVIRCPGGGQIRLSSDFVQKEAEAMEALEQEINDSEGCRSAAPRPCSRNSQPSPARQREIMPC